MVCFLHFLWSVKNDLWGDMKMFPSGPFLTFLCKWGRMDWIDLEPSNERKKLTIHDHGSVQEKNFRELSWLLMLSVYSREKRLTHYDLGPVCPKNDAWMAGHRQLLSGDQEEKIRASPSFCQEQIWDPLFTAEFSKFLSREDSLEG